MLLLMFLLTVLGEPVRFFLLRKLRVFSDLDFIQILVFDVYIGGMVLYFLAVLPFNIFNHFVLLFLTAICLLVSLFIHIRGLFRCRSLEFYKKLFSTNRRKLIDYILVFGMFLFLLLFHFYFLSGLVFGGIFDESIHALKVEVILENGRIPITLQPYLAEGIVYPAASHVIFAYAVQMLNLIVPKSVFFVTLFFKALTVFGAYFLGRKLNSESIFALSLSFVFTFVSSWPLFVVWGSNPFLVGFPLFLVNLGILFSLFRSGRPTVPELAAAGFLFGYNGALIISYIQNLILIVCLMCLYRLILKGKAFLTRFYEFLVVFSTAFLVLSPFIYRFISFYHYPGHNIGVPTDFLGYEATRMPFQAVQAIVWVFENLSPHYTTRILFLILLGMLAFWILKERNKSENPICGFALALCSSATILSILPFFLPSDLELISWGHQGIIITASLNVFIALLYTKLKKFFFNLKPENYHFIFSRRVSRNLLLGVLVFLLLNIPFLYYRIVKDPKVMYDTYKMYAVTTENDYRLMEWMRKNISRNAVILVSPYESGLFIPTISCNKIIFPYTTTAFSKSYQNLKDLILKNVLNQTTYKLIRYFNISHVFVGSDAGYWWFKWQKWDPLLFLGNPNFKLVKNFGNAYLFEFNYSSPYTVFFDDFKRARLDEFGWQIQSHGNGFGNATIVKGAMQGLEALKITAEAFYSIDNVRFAYSISRKIFVGNNSKVAFSFYLNASEGFNGKDSLVFVFSNIHRNQSIVITTPGGLYENYAYKVTLAEKQGFFEFNGDESLSALWLKWYKSSLPNVLFLDIINYDTDGVRNTAYIDNLKVFLTP
ncbi:MAG: hypothetical protein QXV01_02550 [Candidatus Bathyarchaeia archaeon]